MAGEVCIKLSVFRLSRLFLITKVEEEVCIKLSVFRLSRLFLTTNVEEEVCIKLSVFRLSRLFNNKCRRGTGLSRPLGIGVFP